MLHQLTGSLGAGSRGLLKPPESGRPKFRRKISAGMKELSMGEPSNRRNGRQPVLADCGIGIRSPQLVLTKLDFFISLNEENHTTLIIPTIFWNYRLFRTLLGLLKARNFRRQIESLGGYE